MKNLVLYGNCHTSILLKCLLYSKTIQKNYNIKIIYIVDFLETEKLNEDAKNLFKNADFAILQYIENDRGQLNHQFIIDNFLRKDCKIILFPHFRFKGYVLENTFDYIKSEMLNIPNIPLDILKLFNKKNSLQDFQNEFFDVYNNIKTISKEKLNELLNQSVESFKIINYNSTIDMLDFLLNNYKKYRLFGTYGYPAEKFFYELVKRILERINIFDMDEYKEENDSIYNEWNHTLNPIIPSICKNLEFEHNTKYNNLTIFNYKKNINNLPEYYYEIIDLYLKKNSITNYEINYKNSDFISNVYSNIFNKYSYVCNFINFKNYEIIKNIDFLIIKEIINEPKENYSFGIVILDIFKNINLINNSFNIKINLEAFNETNEKINSFNVFDGKKWILNTTLEDEITIYFTNSKARINSYKNKFIKIKKLDFTLIF